MPKCGSVPSPYISHFKPFKPLSQPGPAPRLQLGTYQLEAQRGRFVGASQLAFVVVPDPLAAAELRQLEVDAMGEHSGLC